MATFLGNVSPTQTTYTLSTGTSIPSPIINITGGGTTWANTGYSTASSTPTLHVTGNTNIDGSLTVAGVDIVGMLEKIESHLGIVTPNKALEAEFDELKALGDAYREAEKKFKEQKRVFEILKQQDQ